jgi:predicted phosphohydrolase
VKASVSHLARSWRFLAVAALVFIPGVAVAGAVVADRLGYCMNSLLPGEIELNADPYVQNTQQNAATLLWRTSEPSSGIVRYGTEDDDTVEISVPASKRHEVELTDLQPATAYSYEVEWGDREVDGTFSTAPDANSTVRMGVIGDSGSGSGDQFRVAEQLQASDPDIVLHTGDVVYRRGALCHYGQKFFDPYGDLIDSVPVYPAIGNHDLMAGRGSAYLETFSLRANNEEGSELYYSFDYGPVHIAVIDSEFYAEDDDVEIARQREWLRADLSDSNLPWTVVVTHRPPFSSNEKKMSHDLRDDLTPLFEQLGVDLVLSGHAHSYERFDPMNGVSYIVTGGGGAGLHGIEPGPDTAVALKKHHFVQIDASPDSLRIAAIDENGDRIDRFDIINSS